MKIVIAPDSFKESLSALEVARAIKSGFEQVFPDADFQLLPMADGGEGTVDTLVDGLGGKRVELEVTGPLGTPVLATYGVLNDDINNGAERLAVIEMASASGLHLVPLPLRNPLLTTSFGTGELIRHALDSGIRRFILGLGGSATNDAGAGLLEALGLRLLDMHGKPLARGGAALAGLASIDLSAMHPALKEADIQVACDVDNPLCGPKGASEMFGPQKGATPDMIASLDSALEHFAQVVSAVFPDKATLAQAPGSGAAGGMGYGMQALLDARLTPGIELVMTALQLEHAIEGAQLVITGEGRIDGQTVHGKTPMGVLQCARRHDVPCIAFTGCIGPGVEAIYTMGMKAVFPIVPGVISLEQALAEGAANLTRTSANVAALLAL